MVNIAELQLPAEAAVIAGFQQPRAQDPMYFEGRTDNLVTGWVIGCSMSGKTPSPDTHKLELISRPASFFYRA
jgi:hypothetical protein